MKMNAIKMKKLYYVSLDIVKYWFRRKLTFYKKLSCMYLFMTDAV